MKDGVIPGKDACPSFYVPERVFFHNLFLCCQCELNTLFNEINEKMRQEIYVYQNDIHQQLTDIAGSNLPISASKNEHILPDSFIEYVEKNHKKRARSYLLTKCYSQIYKAKHAIRQSHIKRNIKPISIDKDKEILRMFENLICRSEALSDRQLYRMLQPFGEAQDVISHKGKTYSRNSEEIVRFTISKVFPKMQTFSGKSFLTSFISTDWENTIYKIRKNGTYSRVISLSDGDQNFEMNMQSHFSKLCELASHSDLENPSITDSFGEELLKMYEEICNYNENGKIWGLQCDDEEFVDLSEQSIFEQNQMINKDEEKYKYDVEISSHICNFMRWINMPIINSPTFLVFIDRIIEEIRDVTIDKIGKSFSHEEFCSYQKKDDTSDSLFLWGSNTDLLYLLIDAMHNKFQPI